MQTSLEQEIRRNPVSGWKVVLLMTALSSAQAFADGGVVDKVYHPYVDALENEIEFRALFQSQQGSRDNDEQIYQLSYGRSLGQKLFGEAYVVGARDRSGSFDIEAYEVEVKWQLTEQGQYAADWGLLFEWEDQFDADIREVTAGLLVEKEFGRFSGAANLTVIREWGGDIEDEVETAFASQLRYRYSRVFEPALEVYAGQDYRGAGPVATGNLNLGIRKSLSWEAGVIFGLDSKSPNESLRFLIEFEF